MKNKEETNRIDPKPKSISESFPVENVPGEDGAVAGPPPGAGSAMGEAVGLSEVEKIHIGRTMVEWIQDVTLAPRKRCKMCVAASGEVRADSRPP